LPQAVAMKALLSKTMPIHQEDQQSLNGLLARQELLKRFWQTGEVGHSQGTVPPKCPGDLNASASYWSETADIHDHRAECQSGEGCQTLTNLERMVAVRGALHATKTLLNNRSVPYVLYAGSALGQSRCNDVLPWDSDCDVAVAKEDLAKLTAGELASHPGYELRVKSACIPFSVIDLKTGLYCDIFQVDLEADGGRSVALNWAYAESSCPQFPEWNGHPAKCEVYPTGSFFPAVDCELHGASFKCANAQDANLAVKYGASWQTPDVSTRA